MKQLIPVLVFISMLGCKQPATGTQQLQSRIDSLEKKLTAVYKPGFGEFMSSIQTHHAKLWFAGQNQNWRLADFEIHEIIEAVENIRTYQTERSESKEIGMISAALDSVTNAIQQKNQRLFTSSYVQLTNTCNKCHQAVDFGFNVVKIPEVQTFSNQDFRIK